MPEGWGRADCISLLRHEVWALFQRKKRISSHEAKLKLYSGLIVKPLRKGCYRGKAKKCYDYLG